MSWLPARLLLRLHPSKTLLRPGEAVDAALAAPGAAQAVRGPLEGAAALDWRNYTVSDYDDAGQVKWLADTGIDLIRGDGRLIEPGMLEVAAPAQGEPARLDDCRKADEPPTANANQPPNLRFAPRL